MNDQSLSSLPPDRSHIQTEAVNPASDLLDVLPIAEAVALMHAEDIKAVEAVGRAGAEIAQAVAMVSEAFKAGGRLVYFGAGTSGRLGVLDASECPPTFQSDPGMVVGVIAGGDAALQKSIENVEDDAAAGARKVQELHINKVDVVFGIAAGGTTPFVHGALAEARKVGAKTIFLVCTSRQHVQAHADLFICLSTGPEVLTGSTRLKAGTATKMVLNTVTTLAMVQIGKTLGNLMVDIDALKNAKLIDRAVRIIGGVTRLSRADSAALLNSAHGSVKRALVMHAKSCTAAEADELLRRSGGSVRQVIS